MKAGKKIAAVSVVLVIALGIFYYVEIRSKETRTRRGNYVGPGAPVHVPYGYVASNIFSSALMAPWDLTFGPDGDLFVAEFTGSRISRVTSDGSVSVYAEIPDSFRGTSRGLAFGSSGDLYVVINSGGLDEGFDGILKISANGTADVFARVGSIEQLVVGPSGDIFTAATESGEILRITPDGVLTTFASGLSLPWDLEFDLSGDLFVTEAGSGEISRITPDGTARVFASGLTNPSAGLRSAFDPQGELLVNDGWRFFRVTRNGTVKTVEHFPDPVPGCYTDMVFDSSGNLYVADGTGSRILKVFPNNTASVLVGGFMSTGLAVGPSEDIFAVDTASIRGNPPSTNILRVSLNGRGTTFATVPGIASDIDFDASGDLYVAIFDEGKILKINSRGEVGTFITGLHNPGRLTFSPSGDLFVLESYRGNILRITSNGQMLVFATGFGDLTTGSLYGSLATDFAGNIFLGSQGENNTIYEIFPNGTVTTFATNVIETGFWDYGDIAVSPDGEIFATVAGTGKLYRITGKEATLFAMGLTIDPHSITCSPFGELFIARAGSIVKISAVQSRLPLNFAM